MASRNEAESTRCLKDLDDLLRCPICFDFFNIAMMTKCSHNFCSLCIRKNLSIKLYCPVCNSPMTEQDLQNNRALDELIVPFQVVRRQLSKAIGDTPPPPTTAVCCRTSSQRDTPKKDGSILSHFSQYFPKPLDTRHKKTHSQITSNGDLHEQSAPPALTAEQPMASEVVRSPTAEQPMASELVRAPKRKFIKLENLDMDDPISAPQPSDAETFSPTEPSQQTFSPTEPSQQTSPTEPSQQTSPTEDKKPVIKVECPVCSIVIPSNFINKHLDTCLASGPKKNSLRSSGGSRMRPMGKLVYHLLSLQKLKKKLKECHLSVDGSREQLERKHKEFVHMFNAQCDSLTPKSAQDIAKEVEANEKTRSQLQRKAKPVMVFSKNQPEEEIDTMHSNYRKKHSREFNRLVTQVRCRMESNRCSQVKQEDREEGEEVNDAQTAVQAAELKDCMTSDETGGDVTSDASICSSIPDVFEPDSKNIENMTPRNRTTCSREEDAADPLIPLKRKCKTLREDR